MKYVLGILLLCLIAFPVLGQSVSPDENYNYGDGSIVFVTRLNGLGEVPTLGSPGFGRVIARVRPDHSAIDYLLEYGGLQSPALFSHFHLGQPAINGGIYAFLCGGDDKPTCPPDGGTVTGTITADNILAIDAQDFQAGDLEGAIRAMLEGAAYANVHTQAHPPGQIRGQVHTLPHRH